MMECRVEKERLEREKLNAIRSEWQKVLLACLEFKPENKAESLWMVKDCGLVLRTLEKDESENIPKRKQQLIDLFQQWKDHSPLSIDNFLL